MSLHHLTPRFKKETGRGDILDSLCWTLRIKLNSLKRPNMSTLSAEEMEQFQKLSNEFKPDIQVGKREMMEEMLNWPNQRVP